MTLVGARVLVTGGTGFLGGALVLRLAEMGADVRALVHTPAKAAFLRDRAGVELVSGDVTDLDSLRAAVAGCSVVIHTAAAFSGVELQQAVNADGTRNVVVAAVDAGVERLVHVSSIAVYGYRCGLTGDVTEAAPATVSQGNPYNATKLQAEQHVREIAGQRGLPCTIVRPGMIYGPGSNMWTRQMFRLAARRPILFPGDGRGAAHPVHLDDVVDLTILLATHPDAPGEAFNCAPDPAPTWRDYLGGYQQLAGREGWLALPVAPLLLAARAVAALSPARSQLRDAPDMLAMIQRHFSFSTAKARDRLGWTPQMTLGAGIESCAPWLRERGLLP